MVEGDFVNTAVLLATGIIAAIVAAFKYIKTEGTKEEKTAPGVGTVVAASFVDSRLLKELIDALREHSEEFARENKKTLRSNQDVREATQECTEAIVVNTDGLLNMMRFIKGRGGNVV
jgi:hypothetical protein